MLKFDIEFWVKAVCDHCGSQIDVKLERSAKDVYCLRVKPCMRCTVLQRLEGGKGDVLVIPAKESNTEPPEASEEASGGGGDSCG